MNIYNNLNIDTINYNQLKEKNKELNENLHLLKEEDKKNQLHIHRLIQQNAKLITNISILYDTAKLEIERKNQEINNLRLKLKK